MLSELTLKNVGPSPELSIECAPRLNVFTGDNGLGKSFILDVAWWILTSTWAGLPALPRLSMGMNAVIAAKLQGRFPYQGFTETDSERTFSVRYAFESLIQRWVRHDVGWAQAGGRSIGVSAPADQAWLCPVLYARVDGSLVIWDPIRNLQPPRPDGPFATGGARSVVPMPIVLDPESLWNGLQIDGRVACNGLIGDWVSWQHRQSGTENTGPFRALSKTLETLSPRGEILKPGVPRRVFVNDARDFPTLDLGYDNIPVVHASAGVKRILSLAYGITWAWHEHVEACRLVDKQPTQRIVLLMDEVENHLHPQWQRRIVPSLLRALNELNDGMRAQILLTTHAPMILASMEPDFDSAEDKLFLFSVDNHTVRLQEQNLLEVRQGDAANWLTSPLFGMDEARSLPAEAAILAAETFMRGQQDRLPETYRTAQGIHQHLLRTLPAHDRFWARWIVHQKGKEQ